jgi:hypothetical protein
MSVLRRAAAAISLEACLGFAVAVAFWPGASYAAIAPRWALIAVGVPLMLLMGTWTDLVVRHGDQAN